MMLMAGIPSNGEIKSETVKCFVEALFRTKMTALQTIFPRGCSIHENRIAIAEEALKNNMTHVLFVDADMVFPPQAINDLAYLNKDIVGANYHKRGVIPPEDTVIWGKPGRIPSIPFRCEGVATGFLLVKTKVFEIIDKPWFFFEHLGDNKFRGEDYWFCQQARNKKFDVWCNPNIKIEHIGDYKY